MLEALEKKTAAPGQKTIMISSTFLPAVAGSFANNGGIIERAKLITGPWATS